MLVAAVEERFGEAVSELRLNLYGCPHACAQHWVGDLGFQGTIARDDEGAKRQAYDIFVRGGLGRTRRFGRSLFRRVPTDRLDDAVVGLIAGWLACRADGETFAAWSRRTTDDELGGHAGLEPAQRQRRGGRGSVSVELIDELEAGELAVEFEGEEPEAVIDWALERFSPRIGISTAFQLDGLAVIDMAYAIDPGVQVFSVDTGKLPAETHELIAMLRDRYPGLEPGAAGAASGLRLRADRQARRAASTYESVEKRMLCCNVRKVMPLTKHLATLDAWITGLRRDQWATRTNIRKVEIDYDHGAIVKLNPLAEWTEDEVRDYVAERGIPTHPLYARGYTSIGCDPCTRPISAGEASRAGRWWWESNAPKECGIHCAVETGGLEHELHAIIGERAQ